MKLPRNLSGAELIKALGKVGYSITRQKGSHVRLTTTRSGEHHITIPVHQPLKLGTLSSIVRDVAEHLGLTRDQLLDELIE